MCLETPLVLALRLVFLAYLAFLWLACFYQFDLFWLCPSDNGALPQGILSCIGGFYLFYVAFALLRKPKNTIDFHLHLQTSKTFFYDFILKGFLLNLSNPKAILFFAVIITPFMNQYLEISLLVLLCGLFFTFILVIMLGVFFRKFINNTFFDKIDKICGIVFILFGILLFISSYQSFQFVFFNEI